MHSHQSVTDLPTVGGDRGLRRYVGDARRLDDGTKGDVLPSSSARIGDFTLGACALGALLACFWASISALRTIVYSIEPSNTSAMPIRFFAVVGFWKYNNANTVCTQALAVPEMLCVSGDVACDQASRNHTRLPSQVSHGKRYTITQVPYLHIQCMQ